MTTNVYHAVNAKEKFMIIVAMNSRVPDGAIPVAVAHRVGELWRRDEIFAESPRKGLSSVLFGAQGRTDEQGRREAAGECSQSLLRDQRTGFLSESWDCRASASLAEPS